MKKFFFENLLGLIVLSILTSILQVVVTVRTVELMNYKDDILYLVGLIGTVIVTAAFVWIYSLYIQQFKKYFITHTKKPEEDA